MKKYKKKYKKKSKLKQVLIYTALFVVGLSILFFLMTETGYKVRNSFVFRLIFNIIVCSALLFFLEDFETAGRVLTVCGVITTLLFTFITAVKVNYIVSLLFAVVSGATAITLFLSNKGNIGSGIMTGFFLIKAIGILRDTNSDNDNFYKYLIIVLIVGVAIFLIIVALAKFLKGANKEILKLKMFFAVFGWVLIFSFAVVLMANYAFDFSSPTEEGYVILETDVTTRPRFFKFKLAISDEEKWLDVSEKIYFKYDIGDTVTVKTYKGAFGIEYKIVE